MTAKSTPRWPWIAPILIYAAATLEMVIMVTPFAAYFYSVYTPLLHGLEATVATAWLPQFFLPHLAHTKIAAFRYVEWAGALLALFGLVGFLLCAIQLYYGKFIKKKLVTGGLYGRVRHPQYLMLIIGGAGFLLLWPRFFILVTYLMMLGLYYLLARHEEQVIAKRYGSATEDYLARVPMFNPFRKPRDAGGHEPLPRAKAFGIWLGGSLLCLLLAFGLRALAVSQLYSLERSDPDVTALAFRPMGEKEMNAAVDAALQTEALENFLARDAAAPLLMQINEGRSQLVHLLIDLGMQADARRALELPETGTYLVVSTVAPRDADAPSAPSPFSLAAKTLPRYLVHLPADSAEATVTELAESLFYADFSRILF